MIDGLLVISGYTLIIRIGWAGMALTRAERQQHSWWWSKQQRVWSVLVPLVLCLLIISAQAAKKVAKKDQPKKKQADPYANKSKQGFFLQDPRDGMCLGPNGFGPCDAGAVWILADRPEGHALVSLWETSDDAMCLERVACHSSVSAVRAGKCSKCGTKRWSISQDRRGLIKVSEDKEKNCLVRSRPGSKATKYKHEVEMNHCKHGYLGLALQEVTYNHGFYLSSADSFCFDGERFRACDPKDSSQRWGMGVRLSGSGERSLYKYQTPERCLQRTGKGPALGDCKHGGAKRWSIVKGRLAQDGKYCIVRRHDNTAAFERCDKAFEFITVLPFEDLRETAAIGM